MAYPALIRPFEAGDYEALATIAAAIDPEVTTTAEWLRQRDATRNPEHRQVRLVAEYDGHIVGWGQVGHMWWSFHPHKFVMRLNVHPAHQGQGIGASLFHTLFATLLAWRPIKVETETREGRDRAIRFLLDRDFGEARRRYEARLDLTHARVDSSVAPNGIAITTFEAERVRRGEKQLQRDLFDLEMAAAHSEPGYDPEGAMSFEQFVLNELSSSAAMPEANFLALDGARIVGVSRLARESRHPDVIHVGFTGVHPDYRGRGVARALKARTVEYARAHGYREIRTQNDTRNGPMVHINESLGFVTEPAWIVFERTFAAQ